MHVKYTGPHEAVEVPEARLVVKRNQTIEVTRELGERMIEQADAWKKSTPTKSAEKADPVPTDPDLSSAKEA